MKDFLGNPILEGDTVILARRYGNSAEMVTRVVVELDESEYRSMVKVKAPSGRSGWTSPSNLVVIGFIPIEVFKRTQND